MLTRSKLASLLSFPHPTLRLLSTTTASASSAAAGPMGQPPIRVALTESAGRGVFATRRIGIGELIHTARPVVSHPSLASVGSVCYYCLRRLMDGGGGGGGGVRFCSEGCRSQSKVQTDGWDMVEKEVQAEYALLRNALVAANFSEEAAASVDHEDAVGNAVYILPSFYNHDCDPNAHIIWIDNVDAKLKALREIEEGEELRICYIDASMDRDTRQNILRNGFGKTEGDALRKLVIHTVSQLAVKLEEELSNGTINKRWKRSVI
ncbi:Histone-lysine N-methyltransferase ATXR4-like protein, partial [Drosera capensis]